VKDRAHRATNNPAVVVSRRTLAAASLAALAGGVVVGSSPVGAQDPAAVPYRSSATSTALELNLLGQSLTIGVNEVAVDGTPLANAHAVGALLPGLGLVGEETADPSNPGDGQPTCSPLALPAELAVVQLAVACGNAAATGEPRANTTAGVASISISATQLLNDTPLSAIPVQETVDQLLGGLAPVFEVVEQLGLDAESLVSELLTGITEGGEVLSIELGPGVTSASGGDASTLAEGLAQGAVIKVVDRALLNLPPVLTIEVGASGSRVEADRATGEAVPVVDPALVRVTVAPDIAALLGIPGELEVAPGQDLCLPLPAPLESCITVAGGRVLDTPDGGKRAESEGVGLRLLTGLPGGGIVLNLAASSAEAAAVVPELPRHDATPAPAQPTLARTGIEDSTPLALALGAAGAAGLALVAATRRRPV
jgi:LPXTG-motif cell wall-anchored protein